MRGYGYQCDYCDNREVVPGDPFVGGDPLPPSWVRVIEAGIGSPEARTLEFCSWRCLAAEAGLVEERRFIDAEEADRAHDMPEDA